MALNDNSNQNNKQPEAREGITRIQFYNSSSQVEPSTYQVTYLFGMMCLKFSPMLQNATPDNPRYDYKNQGKIFINYMDALVLSKEIEQFLQDPSTYSNVGCVNNSGSLLSISNGLEYNITSPCMVLRKIDEKGDIVYTYVYEFNSDRYAIRNFDKTTKEYDKYFYGMAELEMFKIVLDEYIKAATNAVAYSINDLNRYPDHAKYQRDQQIAEKLGIEKPSSRNNNNNGGGRGNGIFGGPGRSNQQSDTRDAEEDLNDLL